MLSITSHNMCLFGTRDTRLACKKLFPGFFICFFSIFWGAGAACVETVRHAVISSTLLLLLLLMMRVCVFLLILQASLFRVVACSN